MSTCPGILFVLNNLDRSFVRSLALVFNTVATRGKTLDYGDAGPKLVDLHTNLTGFMDNMVLRPF